MGLKLNVNVKEFQQTLIKDNKKHVVRDCMIECKEDEMIKREIVNYLPDEKLKEIINDGNSFKEFVDKYALNTHFIDLALETFPNNSECFEIIIKKHIKLLTVEHLEKLIKNNVMKEKIVDNQNNLSDEAFYYLYTKKIIKLVLPDKMGIIVQHRLLDKEVKNMNQEEMMVISYLKALSKEELDIILEVIHNIDSDLRKKGMIEVLMQSQIVPEEIINDAVKQWDYTTEDGWFFKMLANQNLNGVLDYIVKKYSLDANQIDAIIQNERTPRRKIASLYEENVSKVIFSKNPRLPILSCHIQSL